MAGVKCRRYEKIEREVEGKGLRARGRYRGGGRHMLETAENRKGRRRGIPVAVRDWVTVIRKKNSSSIEVVGDRLRSVIMDIRKMDT